MDDKMTKPLTSEILSDERLQYLIDISQHRTEYLSAFRELQSLRTSDGAVKGEPRAWLEDATRSLVAMIDEWYGSWSGQHIPAAIVAKRLARFQPTSTHKHPPIEPAGVTITDEMVERASKAQREYHQSHEMSYEHDGMHAALTAALEGK